MFVFGCIIMFVFGCIIIFVFGVPVLCSCLVVCCQNKSLLSK